jgi:abnormal spindle-like microcephaly-associated protein
LSALADVRDPPQATISNVTARDIVDGHREKTLSLLWAIVSKWGLELLVNRHDLEREILGFSDDAEMLDSHSNTSLVDSLKCWASVICRKHGIVIDNLTTSFADGRAFAAIIETYTSFIPSEATVSLRSQASGLTSLKHGLRSLGCSKAFIAMCSSTSIPSKSTTITSLAFLASRLIPLARNHRAATIIQRVYRCRLARRMITKRLVLARLARECSTIVHMKERIINAATVLQKAWKEVLRRSNDALNAKTSAFQTMARGWAVRRALAGVLPGLEVYDQSRRIRGGW